jgi:Ca2+-binding EF-hand superfamily protein
MPLHKKKSRWSKEAREARQKKHNSVQFHSAAKHFPQLLECFEDGECVTPGITQNGCVVLPTFLSLHERKVKALKTNTQFTALKETETDEALQKKTKKPFVREFSKNLTSSALDEIKTLSTFRHDVIFKKELNQTDYKGANQLHFEDEDAMPDKKLQRKVLFHIRKVTEMKLVTGDLDLSSFEGEAMLPEEFRRLFRQALQIGLNNRQLKLVMEHFDKDGDGSIEFMEVHAQLMHPHRLTQSSKKNQEEKFQEAMQQIRIKAAAQVDHGINRMTGEKKKFDLKSLFGHFDTDGDGTVTREEFLECMVSLGIELNKFELNTIFWTLDPDKSGHLTYQEFSRAFFDRRNRNQKKPKRLKPHWTPNNGSQARTHFSEGRKNCIAMGAEYHPKKTMESISRPSTTEKSKVIGPSIWHINSNTEAKESTRRKVFLHSKTQEVLDFEKTLSKVKSDQNLRKVLDRHEEGRDRWKRRNPDYKKKKYVIYI